MQAAAVNFCSSDIPRNRRLASWKEFVDTAFVPASIRVDDKDRFFSRVSTLRVGDLAISEVCGSSQRVMRTERDTRRIEGSHYFINFQLDGVGYISQAGRVTRTCPGEFVLYDTSRPYTLSFDRRFRQGVLQCPRTLLRERLAPVELGSNTAISGTAGPGRFLYHFVNLLRETGVESDALAGRVQEHLLDLVATALMGAPGVVGARVSAPRRVTLFRAKCFIEEHLRDPELSPQRIAEGIGISPRYLYDLFEEEDCPVAKWILDRRLERCRRDLESPLFSGSSISSIAYAWGFSSNAHFSRSFRARFGVSPREFRRAAGTGN